MVLVVGLGNPDSEYSKTRHNVGFEVVDCLAERSSTRFSDNKFKAQMARATLAGERCWLMKPQTYMNLSGESVGPAFGFFKLDISDVIVIHDELDLGLGRVKLKKGGGHGGHNGLRSLVRHLPSADFVRVRVGIDRPPPKWDPADYVLSRFSSEERSTADGAVNEAANAVEAILRDGLRKAMNFYNRQPEAPDEEGKGKAEKGAS